MHRLLVTALALAACTAPPAEPVASLKIATWNLEHLAQGDGTGCRPRQAADYAKLRRHAEAIGADVVAFQEVESVAAAARVFPADRWQLVVEARPPSARRRLPRGAVAVHPAPGQWLCNPPRPDRRAPR